MISNSEGKRSKYFWGAAGLCIGAIILIALFFNRGEEAAPPAKQESAPWFTAASAVAPSSARNDGSKTAKTPEDPDCKGKPVEISRDQSKLPAEVTTESNKLMTTLLSRLHASSLERDRAIAFHIQASLAAMAASDSTREARPNCYDDIACRTDLEKTSFYAVQPAISGLAQLAVASSDPAIYATALARCQSSEQPACKTLSAARLAELDPDNAASWSLVASEAYSRHDQAAYLAALQRAGRAPVYSPRHLPMGDLLHSDLVQQSDLAAKLGAIRDLMMAHSADYRANYWPMTMYCDVNKTRDPDLQMCSHFAEMLLQSNDSFTDRSIGVVIAKRAGWPPDKIAPWEKEANEIRDTLGSLFKDPSERDGCKIMKSAQALADDVFALGEIGAWRKRIAARQASGNR